MAGGGDPNANDALIAAHASPEWLAGCAPISPIIRASPNSAAREVARAGSSIMRGRAAIRSRRHRDVAPHPRASYATITTFEPLTDVTYVPCVGLLDFWLQSGRLELVVYANGINFGKKGIGNLAQLAELQRHVAEQLDAPVGPLVMIIKSATIYLTEVALMRDALAAARGPDGSED